MWRTSPTRRREYQGGDSDSNGYRRPHQDWRPPDRRGYPGGRPPDRGGYPDRGWRPPDSGEYLGRGPPDRGEGPPGGGYPNGGGGPPIEEDPLELLEDKDHEALKDPLDQ